MLPFDDRVELAAALAAPVSSGEQPSGDHAHDAGREIAADRAGGTLVGRRDRGSAGPDRAPAPVEFDSRKLQPAGLFVAFAGEQASTGTTSRETAIAAGAAAVLGTRAVPGVPTVVVDDPRAAMGRLARAVVDRLPELTIVGITGSSGKTTTKDLHRPAAGPARPDGRAGRLVQQRARAPYTVLQADADTRFLVAGDGRTRPRAPALPVRDRAAPDRRGDQRRGRPHRRVRLGRGRSPQAKGELVEALPAGRRGGAQRRRPPGTGDGRADHGRVVLVGEADDAHVRAATSSPRRARAGRRTRLDTGGQRRPVSSASAGRHQVGNSLAGGRGGARGRACRLPRWRRRWASCGWCRAEGWMSSTGPTVSPSSTTRTTPTRRRWRRPCTRWPRSVAGRRRIAVLGYHGRAR